MNCGLKGQTVAMGTEVDRNSDSVKNHRDDDFQNLEQDFRRLK